MLRGKYFPSSLLKVISDLGFAREKISVLGEFFEATQHPKLITHQPEYWLESILNRRDYIAKIAFFFDIE